MLAGQSCPLGTAGMTLAYRGHPQGDYPQGVGIDRAVMRVTHSVRVSRLAFLALVKFAASSLSSRVTLILGAAVASAPRARHLMGPTR